MEKLFLQLSVVLPGIQNEIIFSFLLKEHRRLHVSRLNRRVS